MNGHRSSRPTARCTRAARRRIAAALLLTAASALLPAARARAAELHDPSAWRVLVPAEEAQQLAAWNGRLAAADKSGGLLLLDPAQGSVQVLTTADGLTVNALHGLAIDAVGRLWVATGGGGIVSIDPNYAARRITSLLSLDVAALAVDGESVYYGTALGAGRIVSGLPQATWDDADGLIDNHVQSVAAYAGRIWFGTATGVSEFSSNVFTSRTTGLGRVFVYDLVAGPSGVFAATDLGVHRFDDATSSWIAAGTGLSGSIRAVALVDSSVVALAFPAGRTQLLYRLPRGASAWDVTSLATEDRELTCAGAGPTGDLWLGGVQRDTLAIAQDPRALLLRGDQGQSAIVRRMFGAGIRGAGGVEPDGQGGSWMVTEATRAGATHLRADGTTVAYNLAEPQAGVGWCTARTKFAVQRSRTGSLWVSTLGDCVTELSPSSTEDPRQAVYTHYSELNSGIQTRRVLRIVEDPLGRLWFLSDGNGPPASTLGRGLDLLLDPANPVPAASWLAVRTQNSQLAGDAVRAVTFDAGGIAWLCVDGIGVQRWDVDGPAGDQTPEQTMADPARWDLIGESRLTNSGIFGVELLQPRGVGVGNDRTLWIGTADEGLLHLAYVRPDTALIGLDRIGQKLFGPGLLSLGVRAVQVDPFGAVWVATAAGLNRVTGSQQTLQVDAFTTLPAYDGQLYLPEVISPLPGANVFALDYDDARNLLLIGTQTGFATLDVGAITDVVVENEEIFVYPNPMHEGHAGVRLGGFAGTARVQIYTLTGSAVLPEPVDVVAGDLVWNGEVGFDTESGDALQAAGGLYILVIDQAGKRVQRTLAIER